MDPLRNDELASLMTRAQRGDAAAYERFLRDVSIELRGFLLRRMGPDGAEDVLQDTLIAIHAARATYQPGRPVAPWLYAICSHRMLDFYRRRRRSERLVERARRGVVHETEAPAGISDRLVVVLDALRALPLRQRRVIELLKLSDLSVKEVAARTGMKESAVKVTAFRGYEAIREILGFERK